MRTREKFDTEQIKVLEKALEESHHKEDKKMMRILIEYMKGKSTKEILDEYGISKSKLFRLRNSYKEDGLEGIIEIRRGPKNKLSREERGQLQEDIKEFQEKPESWKEGNLKAKDIKEYIEEYCDTEISLRTCQRLLYSKYENLEGLINEGEIQGWLHKNIQNINFFYVMPIWKTNAFRYEKPKDLLFKKKLDYSLLYLLFSIEDNLVYYAIGNQGNKKEYNNFYIQVYNCDSIKDAKVVWLGQNKEYIPKYCYMGVKTFYIIGNKNWRALAQKDKNIKRFYEAIQVIEQLSKDVEGIEGYEKIPFVSQKNFIIETIEDEIKEKKLNVKRVSI